MRTIEKIKNAVGCCTTTLEDLKMTRNLIDEAFKAGQAEGGQLAEIGKLAVRANELWIAVTNAANDDQANDLQEKLSIARCKLSDALLAITQSTKPEISEGNE
jgi:hypothetical protein